MVPIEKTVIPPPIIQADDEVLDVLELIDKVLEWLDKVFISINALSFLLGTSSKRHELIRDGNELIDLSEERIVSTEMTLELTLEQLVIEQL